MMTHKICKRCNQKLEINLFSPSKYIKDGYENKCKKCRDEQRPRYQLICNHCGKKFNALNKSYKFCSNNCSVQSRNKQIFIPCSCCGKLLKRPPSLINRFEHVYCNRECRYQHQKELMKGDRNPNFVRIRTNCGYCKKEIYEIPFKVNTQKHLYCSNECYKEHRKVLMTGESNPSYVTRVTLKCDVCGKEFQRKPGVANRPSHKSSKRFCSRECFDKNLASFNQEKRNGKTYPCSICGKEIYASKSRRKQSKYFYCSYECKDKGTSKYFSGQNHPRWTDEKTQEQRIKDRSLDSYKNWRLAVYERDKYTCQCCFDNRGGNLVAHHINSYDQHKELRLDVNNGITLCKTCHVSFHRAYGYGKNTKQQFDKWLKSRTEN